jgi:excisionase family DNA binding protein
MPTPAQPLDTPDTLWTATDVAHYLKVSRSWVYHRAESGELPYLRVGGLLRFDPDAIRRHAFGTGPRSGTDIVRPHVLPGPPRALRLK